MSNVQNVINFALSGPDLDPDIAYEAFEGCWPTLKARLDKLLKEFEKNEQRNNRRQIRSMCCM